MAQITKFRVGKPIDFFSLIHLFLFAAIAANIQMAFTPTWWVHLVWGLSLAFGWEVFEYFASRKWPERWGYILERWSNSWITDPIVDMLGVLVGAYGAYLYKLGII